MSPPDPAPVFALRAGGGSGALAVFELTGSGVEAVLHRLGVAPMRAGQLRLTDVAGVDQAIVALLDPAWAQIMCHDGPAVVRGVRTALVDAGAREALPDDPHARFPEAASHLEACMLDALARAASPLAVELLLRQPELWAAHPSYDPSSPEARARARVLQRLIDPPLVVAIGPVNVGKSTLINALAQRLVSIASPEAGATRDHVGVMVDLGGLVVRWVDTPGRQPPGTSEGPIETRARELAEALTAKADLIVSCGDLAHGWSEGPGVGVPVVRCGTRADMGPIVGADLWVAAGGAVPSGLAELAREVREALVPSPVLDMDHPWAFHPALGRPEKGNEKLLSDRG